MSLTAGNQDEVDGGLDFSITLPNLAGSLGGRSISKIKKFDARQPLALYHQRSGSTANQDLTVNSLIYRQLD